LCFRWGAGQRWHAHPQTDFRGEWSLSPDRRVLVGAPTASLSKRVLGRGIEFGVGARTWEFRTPAERLSEGALQLGIAKFSADGSYTGRAVWFARNRDCGMLIIYMHGIRVDDGYTRRDSEVTIRFSLDIQRRHLDLKINGRARHEPMFDPSALWHLFFGLSDESQSVEEFAPVAVGHNARFHICIESQDE